MIHFDKAPGREVTTEGKPHLFFSGFAYLGLATHPQFLAWFREGAERYGAVFPSSRMSNTRLDLYEAFENALAAWTGMPAAAAFSSGYLAAQAAISWAATGSQLLWAPGVHPALQLPHAAPPLPAAGWQAAMTGAVNRGHDHAYTLVMESVDPLRGQVQDFSWLRNLRRPVRLLIDDSHGIGILGERGQGAKALLPPDPPLRLLFTCSLAKAYSCEGGAVCGDPEDIAGIRSQPQFTATTPMIPAAAYAWLQARDLAVAQRLRLLELVQYFRSRAGVAERLQHDPRLPVFRSADAALYTRALQEGLILSSFRYPSSADPLMVRIVLNALHTPADLDRLAAVVSAAPPS